MLITLWILLISEKALSQRYLVHTYTESDGLANSRVYDMVQDSLKQIWFATRNGISVYDGFKWVSYSVSDGLSGPAYLKIDIDERGFIWVMPEITPLRILYFNGKNWNPLNFSKPLPIVHFPRAFEVSCFNGKRYIAVGTRQSGLYIYSSKEWKNISTDTGLLCTKVNGIDSWNGYFVVATDKGISIIKDFKVDNSLNEKIGFPSLKILGVTIENKNVYSFDELKIWLVGEYWIGYIEKDEFILVSDKIKTYTDDFYHSVQVLPDNRNGVYHGNEKYLAYYDFNKKDQIPLGRVNGLIGMGATSMLVDHERNLWVSSLRGVSKISSMRFANYTKDHGLLEDEVSAVLEYEPGKFVFGHFAGVTFFDGKHFKCLKFDYDTTLTESMKRVLDIAKDADQNLWIAFSNYGLVKITRDHKIIYFNKTWSLDKSVNSVVVDKKNNVWLSCSNTFGLFKENEARFIPYKKLANTIIRKIFFGSDDTIYLASNRKGIYRYRNKEWKRYFHPTNRDANNVFYILTDLDKRILIGTLDGLYTISGDQFQPYDLGGKTITSPVYSLVKDRKNRLWIGTNNGVYRWDGANLVHYTMRQGLAGQECNRSACILDSKGRIWIGTDRGVSCYQDEFDLYDGDIPRPEVEILSIETGDGKKLNPFNVNELNYDENHLIFNFRTISYIDEKEIYFRTKLAGFDSKWSPEYQSFDRKIRYTNLPPGTYTFKIQARNALGIWSNVVSTSAIVIAKPFWKKWWLYVLGILLLLLMVFSLFFNISQKRYTHKLEKKVEERTAQLFESEKQYRTTIDSIRDGIYVIDSEFRIILLNKKLLRWMNYLGLNNDVIGKSIFDVFPFLSSEEKKEYRQVFETGKFINTEMRIDFKDEEYILEVRKTPVFEGEKVIRVVSILHDVTKSKKAEQELAKAQALLLAAIEQTPAGIIIVYAHDKKIRIANSAALAIRGRSKKPLTNIPLELHSENWQIYRLDGTLYDWQEFPLTQAVLNGKRTSNETVIIRRDNGEKRWVYINAAPVLDDKGNIIAGVVVFPDITELKIAEEKIKSSLQEKEILLKEVHHRVKNNLQVISSLLHLQSKYIKDRKAFEMFQDSQDRIRSMALVHEKLYRSGDFVRVDFAEYLKSLANNLYRAHSIDPDRIKLSLNISDISMSVDFAIPCGLIINELISNSLKYGFPPSYNQGGEIRIDLTSSHDNVVDMVVSDNGVGLPSGIDIRKTNTLGLKLVTTLVDNQLEGNIELKREKGTSFHIRFNLQD